jgi:hypothetical protein
VTSTEAVLAAIAEHDAVMQYLDSGVCVIEHVSVRDPQGPDRRLDSCPCARVLETGQAGPELGGGQYVSSARHTLADVVRDVVAAKEA